jgi:putative nucleotidyltransferase with HDIG domain
MPRSLIEAILIRFSFAVGLTALLALHHTWPLDPLKIGGLLLLAILAGVVVHLQLKRDHLPVTKRAPGERLVWITTLLGIAGVQIVMRAMAGGQPDALFLAAAPLAAQGLLIGGLVGAPIAGTTVSLACLLLGVAGVAAWPVIAVGWFLGIAGAWLISPLKRRQDLVRTVAFLSLFGFLAAGAASYGAGAAWLSVGESGLWGVVACVIAASIFWLGATLLERAVGLTSDWTLLELCSPDHPLIQELCMRAPGTYAHSVMVGNLAETAARMIGASPVVCRAMAIFHDVGKIPRPNCYIENQRGPNIHDDLNPAYSAQLIISHVKDGIELAQRHDLPQIIIDGIAQHHGTSLLAPFLQKAAQGMEPDEDMESLFRYPGPKPQSKEAAIIHLADSVEAASRLLKPSDDVRTLIGKIVARSLADGQLAECDLTFRELNMIQDSFAQNLTAIRHDRVAYPEALPTQASHRDDVVDTPSAEARSG